jgi:endonuclease YncB( thermonuclease family)
MPYKLIKGEFHIHYPDIPRQGPEPDGDTLKFKPDNPALVEGLHRPGSVGPRFNRRMMINLRFEGIDALETHFDGMHQNLGWAEAARDAVLQGVGFGEVRFFPDLPFKVESVEHHPRRGYIFAKTLDGHGRIVAFVYAAETGQVDGADVWVDVPAVEASLNAQLLADGLVYPAFYTTLPIELKDRLAELTVEARLNERGLWPEAQDSVDPPVSIPDLESLQALVIWPKLFRRLARYFAAGHQGLARFESWLRADPIDRDDRLILPHGELGNMHDLVEVEGDRIRTVHPLEDVIILPDDATVAVPPRPQPREAGIVRIVAALVNPAGPEKGQETVTLLNTSPQPVDLTGWEIADRANARHQLQGTLEPGAVERVALSQQVRLGNTGDTITLFDAHGEQVDQVAYTRDQARREGWTVVF